MKHQIRRKKTRLVYEADDNPWVKLYFDDVEFPDGKLGRYNRIVENDGRAGVAILPVRGDEIGLVHLHRYPIDEMLWETPRGYADSADYAQEARRELQEETGLAAEQLVHMGEMLPSTGLTTTRVVLFTALVSADATARPADQHEIADFAWFSSQELYENIARGALNDAVTIALVFRALLRGLLPAPDALYS